MPGCREVRSLGHKASSDCTDCLCRVTTTVFAICTTRDPLIRTKCFVMYIYMLVPLVERYCAGYVQNRPARRNGMMVPVKEDKGIERHVC